MNGSMFKIASPSKGDSQTLISMLTSSVYEDIRTATHDCMYNRLPVVQTEADYLFYQRLYIALSDIVVFYNKSHDHKLVRPEIFRWLGFFTHYYKQKDFISIKKHFFHLSSLLIAPLAYKHSRTSNSNTHLSIRPTSFRMELLPQSDDAISKEKRLDREFECQFVDQKCVFVFSDSRISIASLDLLNNVDGFREDLNFSLVLDNQLLSYFHQSGQTLRDVIKDLDFLASVQGEKKEEIEPIRFCKLISDECHVIRDQFLRAYELIKKTDQNTFEELTQLLLGICITQGKSFVGSSDIWYHSIAFFNPDGNWSHITYADHLIHEGAHILLHTYNELFPLMLNGQQVLNNSPIRPDPRPLYGTFHATFVFLRLTLFFLKLSEKDKGQEVNFRLHRHVKGFYDGMNVLKANALFTNNGLQLYGEMLQHYNGLKSVIPNPDYKQFKAEFTDYVI